VAIAKAAGFSGGFVHPNISFIKGIKLTYRSGRAADALCSAEHGKTERRGSVLLGLLHDLHFLNQLVALCFLAKSIEKQPSASGIHFVCAIYDCVIQVDGSY